MTAAEKAQYLQWFPQLDVNAAVVTGEIDYNYNCISWTVGVTSVWHWPGSTIQDFDTFYGSFGFVRRDTGLIAAWGHSFQDMLHGSVSGAGHGPRWESKCGPLLRIQHGRDELASDGYGHIVAYYRYSWLRYILAFVIRIWWRISFWPLGGPPRSPMTRDQLEVLDESVAAMDPDVRQTFERLFDEWKSGWSDPNIIIHSNPAVVRRLPQFEALVELGPKVLPALARKLADRENFFALQLYDALAERGLAPQVRASRAPDGGEQGRAAAVASALARRLRPSGSGRRN